MRPSRSRSETKKVSSKKRTSAFDEALSRPLVEAEESRPASGSVVSKTETKNAFASVKWPLNGSGYRPPPLAFKNPFGSSSINKERSASLKSTNPFDEEDDEQAAKLLEEGTAHSSSSSSSSNGAASTVFLSNSLWSDNNVEQELLRERNAELQEVAKSMGQIHEISRDLASIVSAQQEDVDQIENDASLAHERAERGLEHVENSAEMARRPAPMMAGTLKRLVLAFIIIGAIVGVWMLFAFGR